MATFDTDNPANFHEFRRYHNGEMSDREQYDFEKKLLADAAFADAYEGFVLMQEKGLDSAGIRDELSRRLQERTGQKSGKRIAFQVYAAAATVLVVLGIAWLTIFRNKDEQVIQEVSIQVPETRIGPKNEVVTESESEPASAPISPEKNITSLPRTAYSSPGKKTTPVVAPPQEQRTTELLDADAAEERIATGEPVPSAFPAAPQPLQAAREQLGSTRIASNNSVRYTSGRLPDEKSHELPRAEVSALRRATVVPDSVLSLKIAQPEGGWQAYQTYLNKNVLINQDSTTVQVEFIVQSDGTLSDFKVSGPAEIRDQAIQIIRQGPSWKLPTGQGAPAAAPVRVLLRVHLPE